MTVTTVQSRRLRDRLVIIDCRADETRLFAPYGALLIIKAQAPGNHRWDEDRALWVISRGSVGPLVRALNGNGFEVDIWVGSVLTTYHAVVAAAPGRAA